jgi:hypothetical protein
MTDTLAKECTGSTGTNWKPWRAGPGSAPAWAMREWDDVPEFIAPIEAPTAPDDLL